MVRNWEKSPIYGIILIVGSVKNEIKWVYIQTWWFVEWFSDLVLHGIKYWQELFVYSSVSYIGLIWNEQSLFMKKEIRYIVDIIWIIEIEQRKLDYSKWVDLFLWLVMPSIWCTFLQHT